MSSLRDKGRRAASAFDKVRWGARRVGIVRTVQGAARLLVVKLRRPSTVVVALGGGDVELEFRNPSQLVPALVVFGDLIDPEFPFLRRVGEPSWTALDIGAAVGQFSVFGASLGWRVHAFEPSGDNIAMLRRNVERNGFGDRVEVHQLALSDAPGEAEFATAANTYLSRLDVKPEGATEVVRVDTLTATCDRLGIDRCDVVKINVAGYEPKVLEGGVEFLTQHRARILVLLIGTGSLPWYERLSKEGYDFYFFDPDANRLHPVRRFDLEGLLTARPSPARHILAIDRDAASTVLDGKVLVAS